MVLEEACQTVLREHPTQVAQIQAGKSGLGFLVGQVIKSTGAMFSPKDINDTLKKLMGAAPTT